VLTDLLYRSRRAEELLIEGEFLSSLRLYEGGTVLVMSVSNDFMKRFPEISVEDLAARTIEVKGVLVGVMLLEIQPGVVKISLRARNGIDVGAVARKIGGGGHFPASGAKMSGTISTVEAAVVKVIQGALKEAEETGRNA
jgi:phosphoesterase RecJ-like protein